MKSRISPSKKDIDRVSEEVWKTTCECLIDNQLVTMVAIRRFFGVGSKRMAAFLETIEEVKKEFDSHDADGRFKEKLSEELSEAGINIDDFYGDVEEFGAVHRRYRRNQKPNVSIKEAYEIKGQMEKMKKIVNG